VRRPLRRALVLGAGPIGLLAAMLGVQRGLDVHVVDRVERGPKPRQARALGATYHTSVSDATGTYDAVLECCGGLIGEAIARTAPAGAACLVSSGVGSANTADLGELSRDILHGNKAIIGTVNSNRHHFQAAHEALMQADREWVAGLLTNQVALRAWRSAFTSSGDDIKTIINFTA